MGIEPGTSVVYVVLLCFGLFCLCYVVICVCSIVKSLKRLGENITKKKTEKETDKTIKNETQRKTTKQQNNRNT